MKKIKRILLIYFLFLLITFIACSQEDSVNFKEESEPLKPTFSMHEILGYTNNEILNEISGMVASINNPGLFWVHNDSGDAPIIYLVNKDMVIILKVFLEKSIYYSIDIEQEGNNSRTSHIEDVRSIDWEDITITTKNNKNFIVVGDIGDNIGQRSSTSLYSFEEPIFKGTSNISVIADRMILNYAEGARDAEVLMSDPISGNMIILTKRDSKSKIYSFPFEPLKKTISSSGELNLTPLIFDDGHTNKITAGDIDKFGNVIIKNYSHVFLLENPDKISALELLLTVTPKEVNYIVEPQGESLCWGLDAVSYYTISENRYGQIQPLIKYY